MKEKHTINKNQTNQRKKKQKENQIIQSKIISKQ